MFPHVYFPEVYFPNTYFPGVVVSGALIVALEHQTTVKSWFQAGDAPTQAQFSSWIESSMPEWQVDAAIHAAGGAIGVLDILSAVSATTHVPGSVGLQLLQTGTTAAADAILGVTTSAGGFSFQRSESGAVSRTVHTKLSEPLSVKDFGAIGNGTTDDTTAFINTFAAIDGTAAAVYIPGGRYRLESAITASGRAFHVFGDGAGVSVMNWSSTAASQGFVMKASSNTRDFMHVNDLTFFTAKSSAATVGLTLDYDAQVFVSGSTAGQERTTLDRVQSRFLVDNCVFTGVSGGLSGWKTGIDMIAGLNGSITRCNFVGWIEGNVAGKGANYPGSDVAMNFRGRGNSYQNGHPVSLHVKNNIVYFYITGANFDQCEGAYVDGNVLVACGIPVNFTGPTSSPFAANPYLVVTNNDTSFFTVGVFATDAADVRISDNEIIARAEASAAAIYGVLLRSTNAVTQDGSVFANSFVNSATRPMIGIRTEGTRRITIGSNSFRNPVTGIEIGANGAGVASQECVVDMQNTFANVTTRYTVTSAVGNFIGAEVSAASKGHLDLPNGIQIRFGSTLVGTSAANTTVTWSRAFNSNAFSCVISNGDLSLVSADRTFAVASFNTSGFTFNIEPQVPDNTTTRVNFVAFGN